MVILGRLVFGFDVYACLPCVRCPAFATFALCVPVGPSYEYCLVQVQVCKWVNKSVCVACLFVFVIL